MAKTDFKSVDEYIATFPVETRKKLEEIRQIIRAAVPDAKEGISYQIPYYHNNGPVVYFSAFTSHISLATPPPTIDELKDELSAYKTSKSVVQFPNDKPLPAALITRIARYRESYNLRGNTNGK